MDEFEEMHDYQGAALAFLQTFSPQDLAPAAPAEPLFVPSETDAPPPSKPKYTEDQLRLMPEWIETSKKMFEVMNEGQRFIGSDKQAASYGLDLMSEFNWNMAGPAGIPGESGISVPGFGVQVYNLMSESAGPDAANGFLNMLDIYADTKTEGATIKRAFRGLAADPLTYATPVGSLYSLGAKAMARKTATTGLRNMLMSTAKAAGFVGEKAMTAPGKTGMAAGAGYGMGFEGGLMGVETAAGDQPTLAEAATRLAVSGTVGSAVGGALGKAFVGGATEAAPAIARGIDQAGQAAEARMAERGPITDRVMSGADPMEVIDPALAAAGKLVRQKPEETQAAKAAAPSIGGLEAATIASKAANTEQATAAAAEAERVINRFPESDGWVKPQVMTESKTPPFEIKKDGTIDVNFKKIPYAYHIPPEGLTPDQHKTNLVGKMVDDVQALVNRAKSGDKTAKAILKEATWYRNMRTRLRQEYGGLGDMFADLLGATSANTGVQINYENALTIMRKFSRGDYDKAIKLYQDRIDAGLSVSGKDITALHKDPKNPFHLITKDNEKLFGANSPAATSALLDMFRQVKGGKAPKTVNFTGNLIGYGFDATIDVWAARYLRDAAGLPRIPTVAEQGVTGTHGAKSTLDAPVVGGEFGFGQQVFADARDAINQSGIIKSYDKKLGDLGADDLQAVIWFAEKEKWTNKGWTSKAGEGGSFDYEAGLAGSSNPERVKELRSIIGSINTTAAQKKQAREELKTLAGSAERYSAGVSMERPGQVPTNVQQAQLAEEITAPLKADDTVLGYQANNSLGEFAGETERALNYEIVARSNFNPEPATKALVEAARKYDQDAVFMSKVVKAGTPNARPGIEVYFVKKQDEAFTQKITEILRKYGIDGFTFVTDNRVADKPAAQIETGAKTAGLTGVRMQYVPEFDDTFDATNADQIYKQKAKQYRKAMRDILKLQDISYADVTYYDTKVYKNTDRPGAEWINGGISYDEYLAGNP